MPIVNRNEIVVGFSRPAGFFEPFSWLIRLAMWSKYSHTYIRYLDTYAERWIVFQASGLKVNFIGQPMFESDEVIYEEFVVPITDSTKRFVIQKAIDKCGSPYGIGQIIGIVWVLFMRMFGKRIKNPFASTSSYICSELVSAILVEISAGVLDPSTMTPKDVYKFMIEKGYKPITSGKAG